MIMRLDGSRGKCDYFKIMGIGTVWARWMVVAAVVASCVSWARDASADRSRRSRETRQIRDRRSVPEIPVGGTAGALTLLIGGTLIVLERRRRAP